MIRPNHLQKKLLPAAVKQSQTSPCSSSSMEQLQLSSREHICTDLLPLAFILPDPLLNKEGCVQPRLSSDIWSWSQTVHCVAGPSSATLTPTNHLSIVFPLCFFVCLLLSWPGAHRVGCLTKTSDLPTSHQYPVWKHACLHNLMAQKGYHYDYNSKRCLHTNIIRSLAVKRPSSSYLQDQWTEINDHLTDLHSLMSCYTQWWLLY